MKKFLKWFFIVVVILFVLYFIYALITAKIYFDIYTAMKEKVESEDTFYGRLITKTDESFLMEQEVFIKDNVFVKEIVRTNISNNEMVVLRFWQKYLPNKAEDEDGTGYVFVDSSDGVKGGSKFGYDATAIEPENKMYRYNALRSMVLGNSLKGCFFENIEFEEDYTYFKMLCTTLRVPTFLYTTEFKGEKCYAIKEWYIFGMTGNYLFESEPTFGDMLSILGTSNTKYISKETKLLVGIETGANGFPTSYEYFTKEVTDEDIALPNVEEYTLEEYK